MASTMSPRVARPFEAGSGLELESWDETDSTGGLATSAGSFRASPRRRRVLTRLPRIRTTDPRIRGLRPGDIREQSWKQRLPDCSRLPEVKRTRTTRDAPGAVVLNAHPASSTVMGQMNQSPTDLFDQGPQK